MIISDRFVWLHFPKCAGNEMERLLKIHFGNDPSTKFDKIDPKNMIWHQSIAQRKVADPSFDISGRDIICNFRRLPSWILSRVHYEYSRSPQLKVTRPMLLAGEFFESSGFHSKADAYAKMYNSTPVTHWIRTERLAEDFKRVFSHYTDLSVVDFASQVKKTYATTIEYIPEVEFWFSKSDLEKLYEANPIWAGIERAVYGDVYKIA